MTKFNDKFENDQTHNSSCLTSDGCFKRHDTPRKDQYLTQEESNMAEFRSFSRAESQERSLISKVAVLKKIGCQLNASETLEAFVTRNAFRLEK